MPAKFKNLGMYLRQARIECRFSQVDIGNMLGITSQFISNWERGVSAPPLSDLHKLMRPLNLKRDTLVKVMLTDSTLEIRNKIYQRKA